MNKLITLLMIMLASVAIAEDIRVFAVMNQTQEESVAIYNKFHRQLRKVFENYPQYFDTSNTNVLYSPLNGKQATLCWDDCHWWTNDAGTVSVAWWQALPSETNGIPLKRIVLSVVTKDQIKDYLEANNCTITTVDSAHQAVTNSTVIATFGE